MVGKNVLLAAAGNTFFLQFSMILIEFKWFFPDLLMIFGRFFHNVFVIFSWFFYDLNVRTRSQPTPNLLCFFLMCWRCFVDFLLIFWVARGEAPKRGGEAMPRSQVKQFPFCFGFLIFSKTFHYSRFALRASRSCYYRFWKMQKNIVNCGNKWLIKYFCF